ncbi:MAG: glycogen debranching protein GlgX [Bryobacteraceae bacterium]
MSHRKDAQRKLLSIVRPGFAVRRGWPLPLGATLHRDGINFALFSRHATSVALVLFYPGDIESLVEFPLDPVVNRTGDIWHALITGIDPGIQYGYRLDMQPNPNPRIHRFDPAKILIDPYARSIAGGEIWGHKDGIPYQRRSVIIDNEFDWGHDQPLNIPLADSIIYELHVRSFTRHSSSEVRNPGTFKGLVEKIPYLKQLGVTAVELLPVNEFEESDSDRVNPFSGERLLNLWGYQPINFFVPNSSYATSHFPGAAVREFKQLVTSFHEAGIEVILDVVFNHTAEGDGRGPTHSFRGLDNSVYYMLDRGTGEYLNYSGCGNTLNCNHPLVRKMIVECLQYWVMETHVDGFRFDLASILGRGQDGSVLANPPLLEALAHDPVLANTKLIAEAWDAAGLYQVGTFPAWGRWAEWNGQFRDDVRRFVKGDAGMVPALANRLLGSPDLYQASAREPYHSINFITCHDGFTLNDLVSYDVKHNEMNGDDNTDGVDVNHSWNCGHEGLTVDLDVLNLRQRQRKNFAALLLLSHGVPMILAGDELGRSQHGNNNAYCQDNDVSWIDWSMLEPFADLHRFFRLLIAFRRRTSMLRQPRFASTGPGNGLRAVWHGVFRGRPDFSWHSRTLAMQLIDARAKGGESHLHLMTNAHWEDHEFELPILTGKRWIRLLDTAMNPPEDIAEEGGEFEVGSQDVYPVRSRSVVVLISESMEAQGAGQLS